MTKADDEIKLFLIDHLAPDTPKDWIRLQAILELPRSERVKWAYYVSLGKTLDECTEKVSCIEIYEGSLRELVTAKPEFLRVRHQYETIDEAITYGELLVLADELALISFDNQDYVLICHESLVVHYRSLHN